MYNGFCIIKIKEWSMWYLSWEEMFMLSKSDFCWVKNEPKAISHIYIEFWQSDVVLKSDKKYALGAVQVAVRRAIRTAPHLEKMKNTNLISSWALYVQRLWTAPVQRQNTVPTRNKWVLYEQRFCTALLYSACTAPELCPSWEPIGRCTNSASVQRSYSDQQTPRRPDWIKCTKCIRSGVGAVRTATL